MAIRVRKLGRELRRSSSEILGILHAIGYERYRSAEDMLPDAMVERVRRAVRDGVRPVPRESPAAPRKRPTVRPEEPTDIMEQLVPGVRPVGRSADYEARRLAARRAAQDLDMERLGREGVPTPSEPPAPVRVEAPAVPRPPQVHEDQRRLALTLQSERRRREEERQGREAERRAAEVARAEATRLKLSVFDLQERLSRLVAEHEQLAAERDDVARQLAVERAAREADAAQATSRQAQHRLLDLFQERGVRGRDEAERALAGLAAGRILHDHLGELEVASPERWRALLQQRIVLTAGDASEILPSTVVGVTVARERAELGSSADIQRAVRRAGELLMLNGLRRVLVIGGRPLWLRLFFEGIDSRLELRTVPNATVLTGVEAPQAVIVWGSQVEPTLLERYRADRAVVVECDSTALTSLLRSLDRQLGGQP